MKLFPRGIHTTAPTQYMDMPNVHRITLGRYVYMGLWIRRKKKTFSLLSKQKLNFLQALQTQKNETILYFTFLIHVYTAVDILVYHFCSVSLLSFLYIIISVRAT